MASDITPRQREILKLRAEGLTVKATAARLGISSGTVKNQCLLAFARLDASGLAEAINRLGWVDTADDEAERRFLRPLNPDPVTAMAKALKR